ILNEERELASSTITDLAGRLSLTSEELDDIDMLEEKALKTWGLIR
ncbi:MAG: hypothetical protein RIQ73_675, partial [Actinomycetota bacterium]